MATASVYVPRVSCSCFLPLQEALQDQQVGLTQAPFKLLLLPWVLKLEIFCVYLLRGDLYLSQPFGSPQSKPHWSSKPNILGAYLPDTGPSCWGARFRFEIPCSLRRISAIVIILSFVVTHLDVWVLTVS